jgi:uncharacterized repeat protein (TIGR01451 family)
MKPQTTYQERPSKQGFGARLLFYAFLLSIIGLSKGFAQVPSAPVALAATGMTCEDFNINWSPVSGATEYFVDITTDSTFTNLFQGFTNYSAGNATTLPFSQITNYFADSAVFFYYRVRVSDGNSISTNSNTISVHFVCDDYHFSYPQNGATISSRCDFHFCVYDSIGYGLGGDIFITNGSQYLGLFASDSMGNNCMIPSFDSIPSGTHTFYFHAQSPNNTPLDSVTVTVPNTIYSLTHDLTFTNAAGNNGNYNFTVNGLDPNQSYKFIYTSNGFNAIYDTTIINNTSSYTYTHHYPHDGNISPYISLEEICSGQIAIYNPSGLTVNNSGCSSYTNILAYGYSSGTTCSTGNLLYQISVDYSGLTAGTGYLYINWGDGASSAIPFLHVSADSSMVLANIDSTNNYTGLSHSYNFSGNYTVSMIVYDASACYTDTVTQIINISGASCSVIYGNIYSDINNNCTLDNGEQGIPNTLVTATDINSNIYYAWSDYLGNYVFNSLPDATYNIQLNTFSSMGYVANCSINQTVVMAGNSAAINFGLTCSASFDLAVTGISLMNGFFPGTNDAILPHIGVLNASCSITPMAGQVKIILDACVQYTTSGSWSFGNAPDAVITASTGDTLVWNVNDINNIGNFGYFDYPANVSTCTSAQVGDTACITVMVLPTGGDADPSNNTFTRCFAIGVAYDPNSKEVSPAGVGSAGYVAATTPDLEYTINFQNTGTALAHNIYVLDTIDTDLNINSIEILSASHRLKVYTLPNRVIKFMFADILLPDSTHDELHSHGYVTFKIKLNSNLSGGTQIKNTGYIYFDYNEAVVTNTTLNTIDLNAGVHELNANAIELQVYPNPATEKVIVATSKNSPSVITITDVLGKTVKEIKTSEMQTEVNVSDMQAGVYFIKLTQDNISHVKKVVVNK